MKSSNAATDTARPFEFISNAPDRTRIGGRLWPHAQARAMVLIAHGAAEHGARYARLAGALLAAGYGVCAIDHRGHGVTATAAGQLGVFADSDGWNRAVADLYQAAQKLRALRPGAPLVLLGHSLGSLLAQQFMAEYPDGADAVALSGSMLIDAFAPLAPLVEAEVAAKGRDGPCGVMNEMMAGGGFTAGLEDVRTPFDWLSRDRAEVQAYIDDPLCGFPLSAGAWLDLLKQNRIPKTEPEYSRIRKDMPLYVFAGDKDPVNQNLALLRELLRRYEVAGMLRVSSRFYSGARHEVLNETNREQVTADLVAWLDTVVTG